ncbi:hypothetical protein ASPBRDRAFT_43731 [Aspergillus brasiliensis CBS 101740]|uniref:Uncharacterized protein n=1 Tax=Aspergillus brasiliensis (strain CBS 101740 / IMI 381727 / IBT 21946) TaxID=767769 RepID=A0A1L9UGQ8_ASPBC|nr:hypothetical protein ASPBRDRAFT_43731 [Aspergillus brasiliensis CBS 101740]
MVIRLAFLPSPLSFSPLSLVLFSGWETRDGCQTLLALVGQKPWFWSCASIVSLQVCVVPKKVSLEIPCPRLEEGDTYRFVKIRHPPIHSPG